MTLLKWCCLGFLLMVGVGCLTICLFYDKVEEWYKKRHRK